MILTNMVIIKLKKEVRKMSINGNGYDGYSMSNNARMAYEDCR